MLRRLAIRDFVLVEDVELDFDPGLNLITGETGTGKSLLVQALELLSGARASGELVRSGAESAELVAEFALAGQPDLVSRLEAAGVSAFGGGEDPPVLLVRRLVRRDAASRSFLNDTPVTLGLVREVMASLLLVQSQHAQAELFAPVHHLELLDEAARTEDLASRVRAAYDGASTLRQELAALAMRARDREQRLDFLRFQLAEIEGARPRPGEMAELMEEERVLAHAEELVRGAAEVNERLYEAEGAVVEHLGRAEATLERLARFDSRLVEMAGLLGDARAKVEEVGLRLSSYGQSVDYSPARLEQVVQRLEQLRRLARKYGSSEEEVLRHAESVRREVEELLGVGERTGGLEGELSRLEEAGLEAARELSGRRRRAAVRLGQAVTHELSELGIPGASFVVEVAEWGGPPGLPFGRSGLDQVEFLFSANLGEEPRRLSRVASGGELSRVLLGLRAVLGGVSSEGGVASAERAAEEGGLTLLFDEVDAGIGGRVASAVAAKLLAVGRKRQLLVVTHQPQVACLPGRHFHVVKEELEGRTRCWVARLEGEERVAEVARMLAGERVTELTRDHAREMLGSFGRG